MSFTTIHQIISSQISLITVDLGSINLTLGFLTLLSTWWNSTM